LKSAAKARALRGWPVACRVSSFQLLYLERRASLKAIQEALSGVEAARVVLSTARQHIEVSGEPRSPAAHR
jgi:hypothetical protein